MDWANLFENIRLFRVIQLHEEGIRISRGQKVKELTPGIYWQLPVYHKIYKLDTIPQIVDLERQGITTKDGQSIFVEGTVKYKVEDVGSALLNIQDVDEAIVDVCKGRIHGCFRQKSYDEVLAESGKLERTIERQIRTDIQDWGIKLMRYSITGFGKVRNLRLLAENFHPPDYESQD